MAAWHGEYRILIAFLRNRWFLIILGLALVVGLSFPQPFQQIASNTNLRYFVVAGVLFLMAWPLDLQAMTQSMRRPVAPLWACFVNLGFVPLLAWGVSWGTMNWILSPDLARGLLIPAVTPCTLASASVWTRRAGGNDTVSLLVTLLTNLLCFVITPAWLLAMVGHWPSLAFLPMVRKLAWVVVLPMVFAQATRRWDGIAVWASRHKPQLSVLAQCGILLMVFFGSVQTGMRLMQGESLGWLAALWMILIVLTLHLLAFAFGWQTSSLWGLDRRDRIAVGFAGSQKTLMVGLQLGLDLKITILPMIAYHIGQLVVDTLIADRLSQANRDDRSTQDKV